MISRSVPVEQLLPDLPLWNEGKGIALADWIFIEGRADHALGFCSMLWPDIVEFDGYVLRGPLDEERLRGWISSGATRPQVETAMNAFFFDRIFPQDQSEPSLKSIQIEALSIQMCDMLAAKLRMDFPDREFAVFVMNKDDLGVSFHQV